MKEKIFLIAFSIGFFMSLNCIAQNEYKVLVQEGEFILKNLHIEKSFGFRHLKGRVLNNTNRNWNSVFFTVEFYDSFGKKIGEKTIGSLTGIQKGEEISVDTPIVGSLEETLKTTPVSEFKVSYECGEYPVEYVIVMEKPKQSELLSFADDFIFILFYFPFPYDRIEFTLRNKTTSPIKIDWNQISYVDMRKESHRIVHSGVRYIERNKPQNPTIIPPTAKIKDTLIPSDYIHWSENSFVPEGSGWEIEPFLYPGPIAKGTVGFTFSIFMPLEINGKVKNYFFTFKIKKIKDIK